MKIALDNEFEKSCIYSLILISHSPFHSHSHTISDDESTEVDVLLLGID